MESKGLIIKKRDKLYRRNQRKTEGIIHKIRAPRRKKTVKVNYLRCKSQR